MSSGVNRTMAGSYLGSGAAQNIEFDKVGFEPKRVTVRRLDATPTKAEWWKGDDDDTALLTANDGTMTNLASEGITPLDTGFRVGTDTPALNESGVSYRYFAEE